jgi:hypothetical protein
MMAALRLRRSLAFAFLAAWFVAFPAARAAEQFTLAPPAAQSGVENVEIHFSVSGTAEFAVQKGQSLTHPLSAEATLKYRERALPGAGRDARALRALRFYDAIDAKIRVADHVTNPQLADNRRLLVAEGRSEGVLFYSPQGPLTAIELELLRAPGDSLALLSLLPPKPVAVGEKWSPPTWAGQMLTDTEAVAKSDLSCTLESVTDGQAKVKFDGTLEGATAGSSGKIEVHGFLLYDIKAQQVTRAEMQQSEDRTIGPVSPGLKVKATSVVTRTPATSDAGVTKEAAAAVPLEPPAALTQLEFRTPWNVEFRHDREWHVFQQTDQIAVLRLMDQGDFVAQCNLAPVRAANRGEHVPEKQFQTDIRTSLGTRLKTIDKAETLPTGDDRFLYRVIASGESNKVPITWIYFLCAAPSGLQTSFVFSVETSLREKLGGRDLEMLKSLRFVEPTKTPTAAK